MEYNRRVVLAKVAQAQIEAVAALCHDIAARHAIEPERILAHSDVAPGRKRDPGEATIETAERELAEEAGQQAREWAFLTRIYPAIGFADEVMDIWLCKGLSPVAQRLDEGERLQLHWVDVSSLLQALLCHQLADVKTQIACLWLCRMHEGLLAWPRFHPASYWKANPPI
ncbi:MAG: NUDIX domain-containing protein [Betaproteobacteria bacterium]|nr:NUDIX domain-containing protein [Betaproteobacteria bacterium]